MNAESLGCGRKTVSELLKELILFGRTFPIVFIIQGLAVRKYRGKDAKDLASGSLFHSLAKVITYSECGPAICVIVEP